MNSIKLFPLCFLFLFGTVSYAQDFYDMGKIQEIKLYFTQSNWNNLLVSAAQSTSEPYTFCKKVIINGIPFDSVGAKYKGNSTFNATRKKNPWHIELDYIKEQNYLGYKDIKLSNIFQDPSCVREALSYDLMQPYTNLPRANYALVYVNDTLIGLYTNTEAVTKTFCKKKFTAGEVNTFVKCTPPSLMGGSGGASSLVYLGKDSANYYRSYEMNSRYGWKNLIDLCDTLNNNTKAIEKILNVDHALWMLAFNVLFVNLDSYTGGFTQNYYLWQDESKQFNSIIWDLNMSFASFTNVSNTVGGGGGFPGQPGGGGGQTASDSLSLARLNPFVHDTNASKPLISRLLNIPRYRKMFTAHLRTMLNEQFKSNKYITRGEEIRNIIDKAVQNDPNNLSTYAQFKTNFYYGGAGTNTGGGGPGQGGGMGNVTGIVSLMQNRIKYLDTLTSIKYATPSISNIATTAARISETAWIKANISNHAADGVYIGYRTKVTDPFSRIPMYDDGKHNDGNANDGLFAVGISLTSPLIQYYVWAENQNAGIFSPERSEHEYHTLYAAIPAANEVVINEIMASNSKTAKDNKDQYDDWIELHNKSNASIDLSGWWISDNPDKVKKWEITSGTTIPANGYLIIWADEDSSQNTKTDLHANFKLSASGEILILSDKNGNLVDQVSFGTQTTDKGYARKPNGTGSFVIQDPTFKASNNLSTPTYEIILDQFDLKVYPNPAKSGFTTELNTSRKLQLAVFDQIGRLRYTNTIQNEKYIDTSNWAPGIYIIKVENITKKVIVE